MRLLPRRSLASELQRILSAHERSLAGEAVRPDGWESHQPVLIELLRQVPGARALELGIGWGSTPIVAGLSDSSVSLETNERWFERFRHFSTAEHDIRLWGDVTEFEWRDCPFLEQEWDVAFIDNAPGRSRQSNLMKLAGRARFIVCHDTEECFKPSLSDYRWDFSSFRYSWTYTAAETYTTVVSNVAPPALARLGA